MSKTIKDPVALARAALKAGQTALPPYSHAKSPHKYTQGQLFAMLVLREFLRVEYRKLVAYLEQWSDLREALDLKRVPHYSTLCYSRCTTPRPAGGTEGTINTGFPSFQPSVTPAAT